MRLALTVADSIISISLERDIRVFPLHPTVERIVKKEVRQHGRNNRALWGTSFPADQGSVRHAHGRLEPSLNVKQHPFAVRVSAHGAHQKFPVDSVEETLDVEVQNPVPLPNIAAEPRLERRGRISLADIRRSLGGTWAP